MKHYPRFPSLARHAGVSVSANALLDTESTVNLLSYGMGLQLGAILEEQTVRLPLAGNLAKVEARGLFVLVQVGNLEPVRLGTCGQIKSQSGERIGSKGANACIQSL